MPTELTSVATTLGTVAEVLGTNSAMPIDNSPKVEKKEEIEDVCCEDKKK